MTHKNCKIHCADNMIVGRWYKLVTYGSGSYGAPMRYTVNYSCTDTNVTLLYDTVYIKDEGPFTVTVVDMYGNTDSKTINAIAEPIVERTPYTITPTDWADFQTKADNCGTYASIKITKGTYTFDFTETPYDVKEGTILDFSNSTINLTTSVVQPCGFRFLGDYSGIKNCTFVGTDMYQNEDIKKNTYILEFANGYDIHCENIQFDKTYGYNIMCGVWAAWNNGNINATRHWGAWATNKTSACDIINGYIDDDGSVVTNTTEFWTHSNLCHIRESIDRSFRVGNFKMTMPTRARMYDIAFYDESENLLEVMRDLQYYRKYYYPVGAYYVRFSVRQADQPTVGGDASEVMRMLAGTKYSDLIPIGVDDIYFDNISAIDHVSGIISVVGITQDAHFNRFATKTNGWANNWGWDAEDGWASMIGLVVSHSYIRANTILHSAQGATILSTVTSSITTNSGVHSVSIINDILHNIVGLDTRCYCTMINSYYYRISNDDGTGPYFVFGCHPESEASAIRTAGNMYVLPQVVI